MDGEQESFIIKWNSYSKVLKESLSKLLLTGQFSDVSLACEGRRIKCHRAILAAFSPHLAQILEEISVPNAIVYMGNGIKFHQLQSLLTFIYNGEIEVTPYELSDLLKVAEELKVKGLSITNSNNAHNQNQNRTGHRQAQAVDNDTDEEDTAMNSDPVENENIGNTSSVLEHQTATPNAIPLQSNFEAEQRCNNVEDQNTSTGTEVVSNLQENSSVTGGKLGLFSEQDNEIKSCLIDSIKRDCEFMATTPKKSPRCRKLTPKMTERMLMKKNVDCSTAGATNDVTGPGKKKRKRVRARNRQIPQRPSPYGENMKKALDMIVGGSRLTEAAVEFGIPNSTLSKYVKNPERLKTSKLYYYNNNNNATC